MAIEQFDDDDARRAHSRGRALFGAMRRGADASCLRPQSERIAWTVYDFDELARSAELLPGALFELELEWVDYEVAHPLVSHHPHLGNIGAIELFNSEGLHVFSRWLLEHAGELTRVHTITLRGVLLSPRDFITAARLIAEHPQSTLVVDFITFTDEPWDPFTVEGGLKHLHVLGNSWFDGASIILDALCGPETRSLHVMGCIEPDTQDAIADIVMRPRELRELGLAGFASSGRDTSWLRRIAPNLTHLRSLDVSWCWAGDEETTRLIESFEHAPLTTLDLSRSDLTSEGVRQICLGLGPSMRHLDLILNDIGTEALEALATHTALHRLERLRIAPRASSPSTGRHLVAELPCLDHLQALDVSYLGIDDATMTRIVSHPMSQLEALHMDHDEFDPGVLDALCTNDALRMLRSLFIGGTTISESTASLIARAPFMSELEVLRAEHCNLSDASVHTLISAAKHMHSMDVSYNDFHGTCFRDIDARVVPLVELFIDNGGIDSRGAGALGAFVLESGVEWLKLNYNELGDAGFVDFVRHGGLSTLHTGELCRAGASTSGILDALDTDARFDVKILELDDIRPGLEAAMALESAPALDACIMITLHTRDLDQDDLTAFQKWRLTRGRARDRVLLEPPYYVPR